MQAAGALRNMSSGDKTTDPTLRIAICRDRRAIPGLIALIGPDDIRASTQVWNACAHACVCIYVCMYVCMNE